MSECQLVTQGNTWISVMWLCLQLPRLQVIIGRFEWEWNNIIEKLMFFGLLTIRMFLIAELNK